MEKNPENLENFETLDKHEQGRSKNSSHLPVMNRMH